MRWGHGIPKSGTLSVVISRSGQPLAWSIYPLRIKENEYWTVREMKAENFLLVVDEWKKRDV